MICSMTGFGSASVETPALRAHVTARSLNHRFLDLTVHLSRRLQALEPAIKELVQRRVRRGRVEVAVQAGFPEGAAQDAVVPAPGVVASLVAALRGIKTDFGLEGEVSVADVARFPGALERVEGLATLDSAQRDEVLALVGQALEGLERMRRAEGGRLEQDVQRALSAVDESAARIESLSAASREARREQLDGRLRTLIGELGLDEARLYQEVVRSVERHDVAEELQRLRSHTAMAREVIGSGEPAGKRLDFLAQELAREANTIGSKVADASLLKEVVLLKAEVERLREQVQNVE
jgi:uncharacterized protein (TIGR00255 family)